MKKSIVFIMLYFTSTLALGNTLIRVGGETLRMRIVDNSIIEKDAKVAFNYAKNLYSLKKYNDSRNVLYQLQRKYNGDLKPNIMLLSSKISFMKNNIKDFFESYKKLYLMYPTFIANKSRKTILLKAVDLEMRKELTDDRANYIIKIYGIYLSINKKHNSQIKKKIEEYLSKGAKYSFNISCRKPKDHLDKKHNIYLKDYINSYQTQYQNNSSYMQIIDFYKKVRCIYVMSKVFRFLKNKDRDKFILSTKPIYEKADFSFIQTRIYRKGKGLFSSGVKTSRKVYRNSKYFYSADLKFPEDFDENQYLKEGIINFKYKGWDIEIEMEHDVPYGFKGFSQRAPICTGKNIARVNITTIPFKEIIIAKHGSLYKWAKIEKSDDQL